MQPGGVISRYLGIAGMLLATAVSVSGCRPSAPEAGPGPVCRGSVCLESSWSPIWQSPTEGPWLIVGGHEIPGPWRIDYDGDGVNVNGFRAVGEGGLSFDLSLYPWVRQVLEMRDLYNKVFREGLDEIEQGASADRVCRRTAARMRRIGTARSVAVELRSITVDFGDDWPAAHYSFHGCRRLSSAQFGPAHPVHRGLAVEIRKKLGRPGGLLTLTMGFPKYFPSPEGGDVLRRIREITASVPDREERESRVHEALGGGSRSESAARHIAVHFTSRR